MEERYAAAVRPFAGALVDEADAPSGELGECGLEVGDALGEVVQAGAAAFEEAGHAGIGGDRFDQLDPAGTVADEGDVDALGVHPLRWGTGAAGQEFEERKGLGDRMNRDRHMIERSLVHGR